MRNMPNIGVFICTKTYMTVFRQQSHAANESRGMGMFRNRMGNLFDDTQAVDALDPGQLVQAGL